MKDRNEGNTLKMQPVRKKRGKQKRKIQKEEKGEGGGGKTINRKNATGSASTPPAANAFSDASWPGIKSIDTLQTIAMLAQVLHKGLR